MTDPKVATEYARIRASEPAHPVAASNAYRWARGRVHPSYPPEIGRVADELADGASTKGASWTRGRFTLRASLDYDDQPGDDLDFYATVDEARELGGIPINDRGTALDGVNVDGMRVRWINSAYGAEQYAKDAHGSGMAKGPAREWGIIRAHHDARTRARDEVSVYVLKVTAEDTRSGVELARVYLGGIDLGSDAERADELAYLAEMIGEQETEALAEARETLAKLKHPRKAVKA